MNALMGRVQPSNEHSTQDKLKFWEKHILGAYTCNDDHVYELTGDSVARRFRRNGVSPLCIVDVLKHMCSSSSGGQTLCTREDLVARAKRRRDERASREAAPSSPLLWAMSSASKSLSSSLAWLTGGDADASHDAVDAHTQLLLLPVLRRDAATLLASGAAEPESPGRSSAPASASVVDELLLPEELEERYRQRVRAQEPAALRTLLLFAEADGRVQRVCDETGSGAPLGYRVLHSGHENAAVADGVLRGILMLKRALRGTERVRARADERAQAEAHNAVAASKAGAKQRAVEHMRRRHGLQKQEAAAAARLHTLQAMLDAIDDQLAMASAHEAMKHGNRALNALQRLVSVDEVNDQMDELADMLDVHEEVSDALAQPVSSDVYDDDELLRELEAEVAAEQKAPSPATVQVADRAADDDLARQLAAMKVHDSPIAATATKAGSSVGAQDERVAEPAS